MELFGYNIAYTDYPLLDDYEEMVEKTAFRFKINLRAVAATAVVLVSLGLAIAMFVQNVSLKLVLKETTDIALSYKELIEQDTETFKNYIKRNNLHMESFKALESTIKYYKFITPENCWASNQKDVDELLGVLLREEHVISTAPPPNEQPQVLGETGQNEVGGQKR